jgi:hypothetical protein
MRKFFLARFVEKLRIFSCSPAHLLNSSDFPAFGSIYAADLSAAGGLVPLIT